MDRHVVSSCTVAAAQDIVMNTVMYQVLEEKQDPATVLKRAADELRAKQ